MNDIEEREGGLREYGVICLWLSETWHGIRIVINPQIKTSPLTFPSTMSEREAELARDHGNIMEIIWNVS